MSKQGDDKQLLAAQMAKYYADPLGYVYFDFPWGRSGTLLEHEHVDDWQADYLRDLGRQVAEGKESIQIAMASGHGPGKSTEVAWVIHWFMRTRPNPQIIVTANTASQLATKTWRELAKWHNLSMSKSLFTYTATKYYHNEHPDTWFASAIPWSKERSESFAGAHEKHILIIFDEASAIDDVIWEVTNGAMSTKGAIWLVFGNPTRNTGRFFECFHKLKHRWTNVHVDSRKARMTNKTLIQQDIADYGEDSDYVRVRWLGLFPRKSSSQFIGTDLVEKATKQSYPPHAYAHSAIIVGVDVARYGSDQSAISVRQGLRLHELRKYRQIDTMQLASHAAEAFRSYKADAIMVDGIGIGAGVVDRLKQLGYPVIDVVAGSKPECEKYLNKRAEMWARTKEWLEAGGWIPDDRELKEELCYPEFHYTLKDQLQIESKDDMRDRGLNSPDVAESLVYTFAEILGPRAGNDEDEEDNQASARRNVSMITGY
jgi:hypothetical protein